MLQSRMLGWQINDEEWENIWKEAGVAKSLQFPGIFPEGLPESTENLRRDNVLAEIRTKSSF
jgi:hypothetical protein